MRSYHNMFRGFLVAGLGGMLFCCPVKVFAQSGPTVEPNILYGMADCCDNGELFTIDQVNASGVIIGASGIQRVSGLAFRSDKRLFATSVDSSNPSTLVEIDPLTGAVINTIGTTRVASIPASGSPTGFDIPIKITDLSFQPGTDVLYGISSRNGPNFQGGTLFTIDIDTAIATAVGQVSCLNNESAAIGFDLDGTLYLVSQNLQNPVEGGGNGFVARIDPNTAQCLSTAFTDDFYDGLAVRPGDGVLFASGSNDSKIVTMNPTNGATTFVGNSVREAGDIDFSPLDPVQNLLNISSRAAVGTDANVAIAGFIVRTEDSTTAISGKGHVIPDGNVAPGAGSKRVLIRGLGPSLEQTSGATVTGALADPVLQLYNGNGELIALNNNWRDTQQSAIQATGLPPDNNLEAAMVVTLASDSNYTVVLRGNNNGTGVGLIEVYDLAPRPIGPRLLNISTRAFVSTGDDVLIGGFIVSDGSPARVMLRAIGPSLTDLGVPGALQDPILELYDANGMSVTSNDNWMDAPNMDEINDSGLAPSNEAESAILFDPPSGPQTAIVRGVGGTTGVGLIEAYRLPPVPVIH